MVLKKFIVWGLALILVSLVSAQIQIQIDVKDNFYSGEEVYFNYSITALENIPNLEYVPYIYCENSPQPLLKKETINLIPRQTVSQKYIYGIIDENYNSGKCTASISVDPPYSNFLKKDFQITSKRDMDFDITINKKIFTQNENINLDYSSSVSEPSISATLTKPDGTTQQITIPTTLTASQIGTYTISARASKEGYKTTDVREQFGVIEKPAEIKQAELSSVSPAISLSEVKEDKKDDKPITSSNGLKPLANKVGEKVGVRGEIIYYTFIGIIVLLIMVVLILLIISIKKRS